jgi:hypothetical protein
METQFYYEPQNKQLQFRLRERLTASPGVELKGKGHFNTVTSQLAYTGTLKANVQLGENVVDAGSTPLKIGGCTCWPMSAGWWNVT